MKLYDLSKGGHPKAAIFGLLFSLIIAISLNSPVFAQNAFSDLGSEKGPITIDADSLEVKDKDKTASFVGNVIASRGNATLKTSRLKVYYKNRGNSQSQSISRMEAIGQVIVRQNDSVATGDKGTYEAKTESLILEGNVVLNQKDNSIRGQKLHIDITTGEAKMTSEERVKAIFSSQ